jgi:ABC-type branched-subunit amino acid transport system substrate-binding protein
MATFSWPRQRLIVSALVVMSLIGALLTVAPSAEGARSVRGFDGKTITVASFGVVDQFTNVPIGAQARIKRFNDTNEIKGVKIDWTEFADDKLSPDTALSEQRRLVTQVGVFAIVGDVSRLNGTYFQRQHVPYYGWAFDNSYCSSKIDKSIYGFGYSGCLVNATPSVVGNSGVADYKYVSEKTGKKNPTIVLFGTDSPAGRSANKTNSVAMEGVGFKVVGTYSDMPDAQPPTDFSPYGQTLLRSDNGNAPDAMLCLTATACIGMYSYLQANGYKGTYISSLYYTILAKALSGSSANTDFVPFSENTPGQVQFKKDVDAFQAGASAKADSAMVTAYMSTDMFIQALKKVAKKGKSNITPENVQKASMNQTWSINGLAGPTIYPNSTVTSFPRCVALVQSNGTAWSTTVPFSCSKKLYPIK